VGRDREERADFGDTQIWVGSSDAILEPLRDASCDRPVALTEDCGDSEPAVELERADLPAGDEAEETGGLRQQST
jgi:hypothetical protein